MKAIYIKEPSINDLHSAHLEPVLIVVERELDAIERKLKSAIDQEESEIQHYLAGQQAALMKLRRNLSSAQASAIERETNTGGASTGKGEALFGA